MTLPVMKSYSMLQYDGSKNKLDDAIYENIAELIECTDEVVTEYALTMFINEEEFSTLVCTPTHMEELIHGFLTSEGLVGSLDQIEEVTIDERQGFAYIQTTNQHSFQQEFFNKRYITSCCGKSRQSFYFYNDAHTAKKIETTTRISVNDAFHLMQAMQNSSEAFQKTGGVHNTALCDVNGVLISREDIGRHNALDKIYGYCLKNDISLEDKIIAFSGRVSSEILLKVSKIGVGIILSKSAPTALALDMADELGITVIGFIRGQRLNVYTHPERVKEYEKG